VDPAQAASKKRGPAFGTGCGSAPLAGLNIFSEDFASPKRMREDSLPFRSWDAVQAMAASTGVSPRDSYPLVIGTPLACLKTAQLRLGYLQGATYGEAQRERIAPALYEARGARAVGVEQCV
jgi:hypothetical protein